jgi:hypothetical protein
MKIKSLVAALALMVAGPAAMASLATCGSGSTTLSSGSTELFGNSFTSAQHFSDCFSFTLGSSADAFGGTLEFDPLSFLNIDVKSISLTGGSLLSTLVDYTPGTFSFDNLVAGTYQLIVAGDVTKSWGLGLPVGYGGVLTTNAVVNPVPEPETYAMLLMGLGTVGWIARRRKKI